MQTSSFVGRMTEVAELVGAVRAHRLVTLTGVGNCPGSKSRVRRSDDHPLPAGGERLAEAGTACLQA
jgi:hypothetical protein